MATQKIIPKNRVVQTRPILANNITITHKDVAQDWDYEKNYPLIPEMFTYGSNEEVFWKCHVCSTPHESYRLSIHRRVNLKKGCWVKAHGRSDNTLAKRFPDVAKYWDEKSNYPLKASDISGTSHDKAWFICPKCHESYQAEIANRINRKYPECNECQGKAPRKGKTDLKAVFPKIAKWWDYKANYPKKPEQFLPYSNKDAYWICDTCGKTYKMGIEDRVLKGENYHGCKYCKSRELDNDNNLLVRYPEIVKYWDYERNGDDRPEYHFPNTDDKAWFHCYNKKFRPHSFYAPIQSVVQNLKKSNKPGCNVCSLTVLVSGINDLATVCQDRGLDLLEDWDYENNGDKTPNNTKAGGLIEINWVCHICGHKWKRTVHERLRGYGCPACNTSRAERLIQCILKKWKIPFKIEYSFTDNITSYPFDFYIPSQRILIEYDGIQHFKSIPFFNRSIPFRERVRRDNIKNVCAFNEGYSLLRIPYIYAPEDNKEDIAKLTADFIKTKKIPQEPIDFYARYEFSNYAVLAKKWNEIIE